MADDHIPNVLVVEDDPDARANMVDILELDEFRVWSVGSSAEAMDAIRIRPYFAVIVDRRLPDGPPDALLPPLKAIAPDSAFIVVTGYADINGAIAAMRQGADDYILKPLNPDALRASLRRLSERRILSLEKKRSEAAFQHLVEAAECLIILLSLKGKILYFSPFGERATGYSSDKLIGQSFADLLLPRADRFAFHEVAKCIEVGRSRRGYETSLLCHDATLRAILWNLRRVDDYLDEPVILLVGQDITELKRAQEQSLRAERLAAIGQMMAGLAHESRNALQRSQACLEMLGLAVQDRPQAIDYIARIQKAQDDLTRLYEDVRSYAAPIKLECRPCRLEDVWREAWSQLRPSNRARDATLTEQVQVPDGVPILADPFRLEQLFRNIFDNAIAAGRGNYRVVVAVSATKLDTVDAVEVRVLDEGPGLDMEQRSKIFETFYTTKAKGTGLGMPISKRIVEAHGGTITVGEGSRLGPTGAEIIVTLPRGYP